MLTVAVGVSHAAHTSSQPADASISSSSNVSPANANALEARSNDGAAGAHSREADECLRRSESHFNAGRQLYFEGDVTGAHREFDQAVDALLAAPDSIPDHSRIERRMEEICDTIYRFDVEKLGAGQQPGDEQAEFDKAPDRRNQPHDVCGGRKACAQAADGTKSDNLRAFRSNGLSPCRGSFTISQRRTADALCWPAFGGLDATGR